MINKEESPYRKYGAKYRGLSSIFIPDKASRKAISYEDILAVRHIVSRKTTYRADAVPGNLKRYQRGS